jgi:NADH:ubiquinone oxidoreductase subunit K
MCTAEHLALAVSSLGVSGLTRKKPIIIIIIGLSLSFKFLNSYNLNYLTNQLCPPLHSTEGFLRRSSDVFKKIY